jgi:phage gp36-like protein
MLYVEPKELEVLFTTQEVMEASNKDDSMAEEVVDDRVLAACEGATGIINGYLMRRFTIPLVAATPEFLQVLNIHAKNIAREILDGSREEVRENAKNSREWLELFSDNSGNNADTTPGVDPTEKTGTINFSIRTPAWDDKRLTSLGF